MSSKIFNKALVERYPWLKPYDLWTGKPIENYDFEETFFEDIPKGWRIAFGLQMMEDIRDELIRVSCIDNFRVDQIKEKFGGLRFYYGGVPRESNISHIVEAYSLISESICIKCGKLDVPMVNSGWISPYCRDCWNGILQHHLEYYKREDKEADKKYLAANNYEKLTKGNDPKIPEVLRWREGDPNGPGWIDKSWDISGIVKRIREGGIPEYWKDYPNLMNEIAGEDF